MKLKLTKRPRRRDALRAMEDMVLAAAARVLPDIPRPAWGAALLTLGIVIALPGQALAQGARFRLWI